MAKYDHRGREIPDPTPVAITPQRRQQLTRDENIAAMVAQEFAKLARQQNIEHETIEESMDFDVEEEFDIFPSSRYEIEEMQEEFIDDEYAGLSDEEIAIRENEKRQELTEEQSAETSEIQESLAEEQAQRQEQETG
jgi:hypothetical protein